MQTIGHPQPKRNMSWAWKGGAAPPTYQKIAFEDLKLPRKCEICGSTERISIHHKDRNKANNSYNNLMILCDRHHKQLHIHEGDMLKVKYKCKPRISNTVLFEVYQEGKSCKEIAQFLGYTSAAIRYRLKKMEIHFPTNHREDISMENINPLLSKGLSLREIGKELGTTHTTIIGKLKKERKKYDIKAEV